MFNSKFGNMYHMLFTKLFVLFVIGSSSFTSVVAVVQ